MAKGAALLRDLRQAAGLTLEELGQARTRVHQHLPQPW